MNEKHSSIEELTMYKTPEESPGYLLWRVSALWRSNIENTLKKLDLTHPQFVILATIEWLTKSTKKIAQIDISKAACLDPNTTSQILRGLESKKLIRRTRSINERSKSPHLTTLGFERLSLALPVVEKADKLFFEVLNFSECENLLEYFLKLLK